MSSADRWRAPAEAAGDRLDRYLADHYEISRSRAAGWIRSGLVRVDGRHAKPAHRVRVDESLECEPEPISWAEDLAPEPGPLALLFEDDWIAVVDKPAGLVVHPGAGRSAGTLVHRLLARYPEIAGVGGPGRPGIVHRLDRDTTGVLVVARRAEAYAALSRAFAERTVEKVYLAVVYGVPAPPEGIIDAPIGRHPVRRKEMTVRPSGRPARTGYRRLASAAGVSLLRLRLETGRTHQIRVHLKHLGHPLVGDPVYGEARWRSLAGGARTALRGFPRPALHAWRLGLDHPTSGKRLRFEAPVAADLAELWRAVAGTTLPEP